MRHMAQRIARSGIVRTHRKVYAAVAGLHKWQQTASPKPVFARLEGDYVTAQPDTALAHTVVV